MIMIDITSIDSGTDDIYSVERGSRVEVFLNGDTLKHCIYCNTTKGFAICGKRDISNKMTVYDGSIVYDLVFGDITVKPIGRD